MRSQILPAALLAGLLASNAVSAQAEAPSADRFIERNDRNGDGGIDAEEYRNFVARLFARRDKDGDGKLAPGEHAADTGDISREDFLAQSDAAFAERDGNGDGVLDADEIRAARAARAANREEE